MCYREPFFETGHSARDSINSLDDVPPMESGAQQHDSNGVTVEDKYDIEMVNKDYPNPPGSTPLPVFGDQPEQLRPKWFVEMYKGSMECFAGGKTFMVEFMTD